MAGSWWWGGEERWSDMLICGQFIYSADACGDVECRWRITMNPLIIEHLRDAWVSKDDNLSLSCNSNSAMQPYSKTLNKKMEDREGSDSESLTEPEEFIKPESDPVKPTWWCSAKQQASKFIPVSRKTLRTVCNICWAYTCIGMATLLKNPSCIASSDPYPVQIPYG